MTHLNPDEKMIQEALENIMDENIPDPLNQRMDNSLQIFRENLSNHPSLQSRPNNTTNWSEWIFGRNMAWSTFAITATVLIFSIMLFWNQTPTWAEVTRKFKSIPFFHASVYAKNLAASKALNIEIWMGTGGKIRLCYGPQIVFANKSGQHNTYNVLSRRKVKPEKFATDMIEILNSAESFSLETVIHTLTGDMADLREIPILVEGVSDDISIFELAKENSSKTTQIWTLRESLLPVQFRQNDLKDGEILDVFFSYTHQQPAEFFDSTNYEKILKDSSIKTNDLYMAY